MSNKGLIGVVFFLALMGGCSVSPPPAEEILDRLAAHAAGQSGKEAVPATPEDAAAIQAAAAEINRHVSRQRQESAAPAALKTDYEVAVTAPHSMAGTWRMVSPNSVAIRAGETDQYGGVSTFLCRVDQIGEALQGSCLPTRAELTGKIQGDGVILGWGSSVFSAKIAGRLLTRTDFAGSLTVGAMGVNLVGADIPVYATKIPSSVPAPPEIDALAARLFADLGAVRERLYLGAVDAQLEKAEPMHIFDVELDKGWKLCGFTADGGHLECR